MSEPAVSVDAETQVGDRSEQENTEKKEMCRPKFLWLSKSCENVATVQPTSRNGPTLSSLVPSQSMLTIRAPNVQIRSLQTSRGFTVPRPFSFDARDSIRRAAYEKRLEELREEEKRSLQLCSRFKANPVRKYKPLVVTTRMLPSPVPQSPSSSQHT